MNIDLFNSDKDLQLFSLEAPPFCELQGHPDEVIDPLNSHAILLGYTLVKNALIHTIPHKSEIRFRP